MENRKNAQTGTTIRSAVINQAISYIFEHMDEDITVEDVAHHCAYSKYHLTRMFKEDTGEALYHFIKCVRLERSAWRLKVEKEKSITEIGEEYGYSSSNFATAFKKHLDLSPAAFRKSSEQIVEESSFSHGITLDQLDEAEKLITIENLQGFMVYQEIFCRWLSRTGNQMDERPVLDIYRKVREDGYMEIDICFPLK